MKSRPARLLPVCAAGAFAAAMVPASAAVFIASDRTVAGGNPLVENYSGNSVFVGVSGFANGQLFRAPDVHVDVLGDARFDYNDQTGGGLYAYSNSAVRVFGGSFGQNSGTGFGGGLQLNDTSTAAVSGGTLQLLGLNGSAAGAAGVRATVSGGTVQNSVAIVSGGSNGVLQVSGGTIRAASGQTAIAAGDGLVVTISGGLVQSTGGAAVTVSSGSRVTLTGGKVAAGPGGNAQRGFDIGEATTAAALLGGTVDGGIRASRAAGSAAPEVQAVLHGPLLLNGGAFAYADAAIEVHGGSYTDYAGGPASFFAMGSNTIRFFGSGLELSGPSAGTVFDVNTIAGNYYTFTHGTLADGQSAIGLRLFDAIGTGSGGGFSISAVPEPGVWAMLLLGLPATAAARRRAARRERRPG